MSRLDNLVAYKVTATYGGECAGAIACFNRDNHHLHTEKYVRDAMRASVLEAAREKFGGDVDFELTWELGSQIVLS